MKESEKKTIIWHFTLGNGKKVSVTYYPRWSYCNKPYLQYRTDHFGFEGDGVSPTKYHSDFTNVDPNPAFDGTNEAYAFAKKRVVELTGVGFEEWEGQLDLL